LADALQRIVEQFDDETLLLDPNQLRQRLELLDSLDAEFPDAPQPEADAVATTAELYRRARAMYTRLEAVNCELYAAIRSEIQRGRTDTLMRWAEVKEASEQVRGMGYDYLDELLSGVFQFEEPAAEALCGGTVHREPEMVFYQPTPARHIVHLIGLAALSASDVLVDLGSGLGHVPLLASACTGARSIGIELEPAYVARARLCAKRLNLDNVRFLQQDAREADLSLGTVFYLYTPFTGSILSRVLDRLRREAAARPIRVCTYGPCMPVVAAEPWLEAASEPASDRITLFRSRS
jgi:tRNA G46 methylase TrmB